MTVTRFPCLHAVLQGEQGGWLRFLPQGSLWVAGQALKLETFLSNLEKPLPFNNLGENTSNSPFGGAHGHNKG